MATAGAIRPINEDKMNAFLGKVVGDFGAALSSSLVYIGQKLGLYKTMAADGPVTPAELAQKTSTNERYIREWLINQAAGGYVDYDAAIGRYSLSPEQAAALTDEASPFFVGGGFYVVNQHSARLRLKTLFATLYWLAASLNSAALRRRRSIGSSKPDIRVLRNR